VFGDLADLDEPVCNFFAVLSGDGHSTYADSKFHKLDE
jgi:hypothetical protein